MFKISQTCFTLWLRVWINYSHKSKSVSFSLQRSSFIGCGFACHSKSWLQLQTSTVHYHFWFLKSRKLLLIHDLYSKLTWKRTDRLVFVTVEGRKNYSPERCEGFVHVDLPFWGHLNIYLYVFPFHFKCQRSNLSVFGMKRRLWKFADFGAMCHDYLHFSSAWL